MAPPPLIREFAFDHSAAPKLNSKKGRAGFKRFFYHSWNNLFFRENLISFNSLPCVRHFVRSSSESLCRIPATGKLDLAG